MPANAFMFEILAANVTAGNRLLILGDRRSFRAVMLKQETTNVRGEIKNV